MQNFFKLLIIFLLFPFMWKDSSAEEGINGGSFFLGKTESPKILDFIEKGNQILEEDEDDPDEYILSGLIFVDENRWNAWINGEHYSALGQYGNFSIDSVNNNSVIITTADGRGLTLDISLGCEI